MIDKFTRTRKDNTIIIEKDEYKAIISSGALSNCQTGFSAIIYKNDKSITGQCCGEPQLRNTIWRVEHYINQCLNSKSKKELDEEIRNYDLGE